MMNSQSTEKVNRTPIEAKPPVIKVVGLGGGGCNAVNRMIEHGMSGVEFIACNTDVQALESSLADVKVQLGPKCTRGLGAGSLPSVGEKAAEESFQALADALDGADMVFLTAGMGGGTGTGSIPVAARVSKHLGAVTIAVVTTPFSFEMTKRQKNAVIGLQKLRQYTHTLITVPNDRLLEVAPEDLTLEMAFKMADDVLRQGVQGISELLTETGLINVDFAHIRHVMELGGGALMSIGTGEGEGKALKALDQALNHPLLEKVDLSTATGVIANFTGGPDLTFAEVAETLNHLHEEAGNAAEIIPGVINDPNLTDRTQVILIVTGLGGLPLEKAIPGAEKYLADLPVNDSIPQSEPASSYFEMPNKQHREPAFAYTPGQAHINANDLDVPAFLRKRMRG
ncbi:cell division protein FtsZ [Chloroflexota bacterium]|nr:cell division protein FtsZ [Chloroflexota bacterium]